eukprot:TRINITY_DN7948_c0_g1_i2.p1 TRINITY_DN7948_c0_g1~~TRINITY_DN7948_c0_g1_i2.p1  ORF type:complete len:382 (-),score=99.62 TRINITY_DN7948_c0_g1_i2:117-1262(-)
MVVRFAAPRSFTGEDVVELHVHGGSAVIRSVLAHLSTLPGCRPALAGEFTKRAFMNGKLDLTAAEGLSDLLNADTEAQRRQALQQHSGELKRLYDSWRTQLVKSLAYTEAAIDFADDEGLDQSQFDGVIRETAQLRQLITRHLNRTTGERIRRGVTAVIVGAPNVGKSTLLNTLAQRPAAIVSDIPGTTRDVLEIALDVGGWPVVLVDTAGMREQAADVVEQEGIRRAKERLLNADIRIVITEPNEHTDTAVTLPADNVPTICVQNKSDLSIAPLIGNAIAISCKTGVGIDALLLTLQQTVETCMESQTGDEPVFTRERHKTHLRDCVQALERYEQNQLQQDVVLAAEDLRAAALALGRITGHVDVEEVLDALFRDFCIGK